MFVYVVSVLFEVSFAVCIKIIVIQDVVPDVLVRCAVETVHVHQIVQHHIPEVHKFWERRQRTYLGHHLYLLKCMILLIDSLIFHIFLFHIMVCKPILSAVDRRKGKTGEWDILWQFHPWPYWPTVNCQTCKYYYLLWMVEWCNWCETRGMEDMVGNKVMNVN